MHNTVERDELTSELVSPERTVLCHGCWDVLHLGHIRHLQEAADLGDRLIVSVTADEHVRKGMGRPHFTAAQRAEALGALECVDVVTINDSADAVAVIEEWKPDIYVKGIDYKTPDAALAREIAAVESHGGRFHVTTTEKWSSTAILNADRFPESTLAYLARARDRGFRDQIHAAFERAGKLAIAFIGETIIDEYRYVGPLGKPSKEFVLATVELRKPDHFLGGVVAASLHGEWPHIQVITDDGEPIRKTRFVDGDFTRKLFEVYSKRRIELDEERRGRFQAKLTGTLRDCDVAVMLDFGHGLMGPQERHICESAKFLAVNAQLNAGNYGFNPVTRYGRVHYVCVDEPEARMATGLQEASLRHVIGRLSSIMSDSGTSPGVIMTHGRYGCISCQQAQYHTIPPFALGGLDTMGAGDAFLAVSAPLVAAGLPLEAAAFAGNIAGAIKVSILGHQRHVGRDELLQTVDALLS